MLTKIALYDQLSVSIICGVSTTLFETILNCAVWDVLSFTGSKLRRFCLMNWNTGDEWRREREGEEEIERRRGKKRMT